LPRSPHIPLFEAILDEVDQAIAALQNARRFLGELERDTARRARLAPRPYDHANARESTASLRYAGVTVAEAAQILEMSEEHVRRLLRTGELEGVPYSGRVGWRLSRAYVESLAEERLLAREKQAEARRLASKAPPPKRRD
jgi:excisionase family DNA binding protein